MPYALLVEDNKARAVLLLRSLRKVTSAPAVEDVLDGQSAFDFLSRKSAEADLPSFMLLDLRLPRLSGFEVLQIIRESPLLGEIPVIIPSSSDRESDITHAMEDGATDFCSKPVSTNTLQRYIDSLASKNN